MVTVVVAVITMVVVIMVVAVMMVIVVMIKGCEGPRTNQMISDNRGM